MANGNNLPLPRFRYTTDESETMFGVDFITNRAQGYQTFLPPKYTRAKAKELAMQRLEELYAGPQQTDGGGNG